jgi:hypothetical protein
MPWLAEPGYSLTDNIVTEKPRLYKKEHTHRAIYNSQNSWNLLMWHRFRRQVIPMQSTNKTTKKIVQSYTPYLIFMH